MQTEDYVFQGCTIFFSHQVITAKVVNSNVSETSMNSSDNSTDSSDGSPTAHLEGPNLELERMLPSVVSQIIQCYCTCANVRVCCNVCSIAVMYILDSLGLSWLTDCP